jgi:hypothetical protein
MTVASVTTRPLPGRVAVKLLAMHASGIPSFALRAAVALVGAALVVVSDGRPPVAVLGWGLVALAVLTEALASVVLLRRRRGRRRGR